MVRWHSHIEFATFVRDVELSLMVYQPHRCSMCPLDGCTGPRNWLHLDFKLYQLISPGDTRPSMRPWQMCPVAQCGQRRNELFVS